MNEEARVINDSLQSVGWLAVMGGLVGLGQLLASKEKLTARIIVGRFLSSAGLGAAAALPLTVMPDMPFAAQLALAAGLASLGTSALERLVQKFLHIG